VYFTVDSALEPAAVTVNSGSLTTLAMTWPSVFSSSRISAALAVAVASGCSLPPLLTRPVRLELDVFPGRRTRAALAPAGSTVASSATDRDAAVGPPTGVQRGAAGQVVWAVRVPGPAESAPRSIRGAWTV
jgi:hypothetical protein